MNRNNNVRIIRGPLFAEDASPMSLPIRPEKVIEMNNFYTLTVYEKGSEVIRMMHTLLGEEKFQQGGLALFFAAFLAGLALSWTPCVYPMVPILSGIIIGQKQTPSNLKAILMSLTFVFSMSLAYGLIGATAGFFGAGINLQAIMQTPV